VLEKLDDISGEAKDNILILGNSVPFYGMNADIIQNGLKDEYEVYDIAVGGQTIPGSTLFYPILPDNTKSVVLVFDIFEVEKEPVIDKPSAIALAMFGYRLSPDVETILPAETWRFLTKPKLYLNYEGRNIIVNSIYRLMRLAFIEGTSNKEFTDFKYPGRSQPLRRDNYEFYLDLIRETYNLSDYQINRDFTDIVRKTNEYLSSRGILFVLLIPPKSPELNPASTAEIDHALNTIKSAFSGVHILDCYYLCDADDFYDGIHPNRLGAEKLSRETARYLAGLLPASP
jgi:hypothetical protein